MVRSRLGHSEALSLMGTHENLLSIPDAEAYNSVDLDIESGGSTSYAAFVNQIRSHATGASKTQVVFAHGCFFDLTLALTDTMLRLLLNARSRTPPWAPSSMLLNLTQYMCNFVRYARLLFLFLMLMGQPDNNVCGLNNFALSQVCFIISRITANHLHYVLGLGLRSLV